MSVSFDKKERILNVSETQLQDRGRTKQTGFQFLSFEIFLWHLHCIQ